MKLRTPQTLKFEEIYHFPSFLYAIVLLFTQLRNSRRLCNTIFPGCDFNAILWKCQLIILKFRYLQCRVSSLTIEKKIKVVNFVSFSLFEVFNQIRAVNMTRMKIFFFWCLHIEAFLPVSFILDAKFCDVFARCHANI